MAAAGQRDTERKPAPAPLLPAEQAWSVSLPSAPSAPGTLDDSHAYIPLQSGQIVALDRATGVTDWSLALATSWAPLVSDEVVYAASAKELQAVHAESGEVIWKVSFDDDMVTAPALQGTTLLLLVNPDQLLALRASDGSEAWRRSIGAYGGLPTVALDATGLFVSIGSRVSRFAVSDGRLEWEQELPGTLSPPAVAGDRLFVGSTNNYFYALDTRTGRLLWRYQVGGDVVGAAVDERLVYVASHDNMLRALRQGSGNQVWKRSLLTRTTAPPSTFGGIVLVSGNNPTLSAFNATTGDPLDKLALAADLQGVPLVDSTLKPFEVAIITITRDARAIGLRPTRMMFRELPVTPLLALPGRLLNREPLQLPTPKDPTPKDPTSKPSGDEGLR